MKVSELIKLLQRAAGDKDPTVTIGIEDFARPIGGLSYEEDNPDAGLSICTEDGMNTLAMMNCEDR